jgi:hypothetical protein
VTRPLIRLSGLQQNLSDTSTNTPLDPSSHPSHKIEYLTTGVTGLGLIFDHVSNATIPEAKVRRMGLKDFAVASLLPVSAFVVEYLVKE